ncbi:hypothetical protein MKCMC460_15200 [Mycobacterium sp. 20KCMC460]|nr:hypothetical protein MKCMC460_15200 [Mycobacterium sp. 20KCMC460]
MQPATTPGLIEVDACCDGTVARHGPPTRDAAWRRHARVAHRLAWVSLAVMLCEGVLGLWQGIAVGSVALTGWALGSVPEGLASAMVIWRFSGSRTHCDKAERRAQIGVALSFWLTAPYIAAESVRHLVEGQHAETSLIGIALTALALVLMPTLGRIKPIWARDWAPGPPRVKARRTTCVPPRRLECWWASPSLRRGRGPGGSIRLSDS